MDVESIIQLDVAKQRNGPTGALHLVFDRDIQRFGELAFGFQSDGEPPPDGGAPPDEAYDYQVPDDEPFEDEPFDPEDDTPF